MWKFTSNVISSIGLKKSSSEPTRVCQECSDDEVASNVSRDEGLECPICWESFNIVENVPYVLLCGHTLCKNCVLALQSALLNFPGQQIKIPFLISCPWCHLLSLRWIHRGNLKFPRKNFFLLWMVESLNGDRTKFASSLSLEHQSVSSPRRNLPLGNRSGNGSLRRQPSSRNSGQLSQMENVGRSSNGQHSPFPKSLDIFIDIMSKFPLVIVFLLILFFVLPSCAVILLLYLLLTILFAIPSFLVLYFAYPVLGWLVKEITSWDLGFQSRSLGSCLFKMWCSWLFSLQWPCELIQVVASPIWVAFYRVEVWGVSWKCIYCIWEEVDIYFNGIDCTKQLVVQSKSVICWCILGAIRVSKRSFTFLVAMMEI